MNIKEYTKLVEKVLKDFRLYSENAVKLVVMTAVHESLNFKYRRQMNLSDESNVGGFGFGQIELATHCSLHQHQLRYNLKRMKEIQDYFSLNKCSPEDYINNKMYESNKYMLQHNDLYNILFIRLRYLPFKPAIPNDDLGKAKYWKKYYNKTGKGTPEKFLEDWNYYNN